jgi:cytochrome c nitrite reductase small subunit
MKNSRKKKIFLLFGGLILIFILSVSPRIVKETSTPAFCAGCHVMEDEYEAWFLTGMHRNISCVDCHLPNDNPVNHLLWKAIDGSKDIIFFYGQFFPDPITISSHGKKTVMKNCIRCHDQIVSWINVEDKNCWACHRQVNHRFPPRGLFLNEGEMK